MKAQNEPLPTPEPVFYTCSELAERLRIGERTIYLMIARGEIRATRIGNRHRIPREELDRLASTSSAEVTK